MSGRIEVIPPIELILSKIHHFGGTPYFVGGVVRDYILGKTELSKDYDIEVFGVPVGYIRKAIDEVHELFGFRFTVDEVGKAFGVIKVHFPASNFGVDIDVDFSVPRRDNKIGVGHKDFDVEFDMDMSVTEAARRRDFTVNAIYIDAIHGTIIDPFSGIRDIHTSTLNIVDSATFSEDPLRVLRAFQFISRFNLEPTVDLIYACRNLIASYCTIPKERVWEEWKKWAYAKYSGKGIRFLYDSWWIGVYPEIADLCGVEQDEIHHPEGNVFEHTIHVLNACDDSARDYSGKDESVLVVKFAALCHDFGKPFTTELHADGRTTAYGHQDAGVNPTFDFLGSIGAPRWLIERVVPLVKEHMVCAELGGTEVTPRIARRLANRLAPSNVAELAALTYADHSGRPPLPKGQHPKMVEILGVSVRLGVEKEGVKPLIMGRHLIELGLDPSPRFKEILNSCFEAQLDGYFDTVEAGRLFLLGFLKGMVKYGN